MDQNSVLQVVDDAVVTGDRETTADNVLSHSSPELLSPKDLGARGRSMMFSPDQRSVLMRYFEEYGMTSTHRRNTDLMQRCADDINTTMDRVKNWIGSEAVKRKRKAGILPRPKVEIASSDPQPRLITTIPIKKIKRINGYNLFFSHTVRNSPNIGSEFKERNAKVAQKWAEQSEDERKQWAVKAETLCASSLEELRSSQPAPLGLQTSSSATHLLTPSAMGVSSNVASSESLIEKTLLQLQEKFDLLEQVGFEGYAILVNTSELQTHTFGTSKGKAFHKIRQQMGKPLENPFIGHVFSDESDLTSTSLSLTSGLTNSPPIKRVQAGSNLVSSLNSVDTMQKSVMNAFSLKYKVATGRSEVPYDNLQILGVQVYGMPLGLPFHSPLLYSQQQLQQILANLEKIVFLKVGHQTLQGTADALNEVEIATDSLVTSGHDLRIGAEEEAVQ